MDSDPRFAAAAGGAVGFLAEAAGMPEDVCKEFQEATVRESTKAFDAQPKQTHTVEFLVFGDRLEVAIDADAGSHAVRLSRSVVPQR